jgi:predicted amidohydrolase
MPSLEAEALTEQLAFLMQEGLKIGMRLESVCASITSATAMVIAVEAGGHIGVSREACKAIAETLPKLTMAACIAVQQPASEVQ